MSARTRRQKAAAAALSDESDVPSNGNGAVLTPPTGVNVSPAVEEPQENIFLFYPNVIGTYAEGVGFFCRHAT